MEEQELDPGRAEAVRRLLAEARHDEPMPADVVARLDEVIAGLADEGHDAVVTPLRRPSRAPKILLAAAAVAAIAFGSTQLLQGGLGSGSDNDSAGVASREDATGGLADSPEAGATLTEAPLSNAPLTSPPGVRDERADDGAATQDQNLTPVQELARLHLRLNGVVELRSPVDAGDLGAYKGADVERDRRAPANLRGLALANCGPVAGTSGATTLSAFSPYAATYDGRPAAVILHPELFSVRKVDIYVCGGPMPAQPVESVYLREGE